MILRCYWIDRSKTLYLVLAPKGNSWAASTNFQNIRPNQLFFIKKLTLNILYYKFIEKLQFSSGYSFLYVLLRMFLCSYYFCKFRKKDLIPKWTIYKHVSAYTSSCRGLKHLLTIRYIIRNHPNVV